MHSLDCDELNLLWPNDYIILTFFFKIPLIGHWTEQLLSKKFFNQIHSLDCDEMNLLWPNDSLILTLKLMDPGWLLWTLHGPHGPNMTIMEPPWALSLIYSLSMNQTRTSLNLIGAHGPCLTLMDPPWPPWTIHDPHGLSLTCMDPTWP